jgi:hypothetical protein
MSRLRKTVLLAAAAVSVAAPASGALIGARPVQYDAVSQGDGAASGLTDRADYVIRTKGQWRRMWAALNERVTPTPARPAVDFRHSMLLLVTLGREPTSGYAIAVTGVSKGTGRLVADVEERSPGSNCFVAQHVTAPYQVVRVPRGGVVRFRHHATTADC